MICFDGPTILLEPMNDKHGHWIMQRIKESEFGFWEKFIGYKFGTGNFHKY